MKCTDVIARVLQAEGVELITCFPLNPVIDAVAALNIRPLVARTERVVVNIADGYSRMTSGRKIGVSAVQYSAGSENAFAAVAQAYGDSTPLLVLAGALERASLSIPRISAPAAITVTSRNGPKRLPSRSRSCR